MDPRISDDHISDTPLDQNEQSFLSESELTKKSEL